MNYMVAQAGREEIRQEYKGMVRPKQSYQFACMDEVSVNRQDLFYCIQRLPYVVRYVALSSLKSISDTCCH